MKMRFFSSFRGSLAMMLVAIAVGQYPARADLITNLGVSTTLLPGGLTEYDYTLSDITTSTVDASFLYIDVSSQANLSLLTAPTGWDISYSTGDTTVIFTSPDPSVDITPGTSGMFSFESPLAPMWVPYEVAGIDSNYNYVTNDGLIFSASVPEPTSGLLCALGILGVAILYRRSNRKQSV